MLYNLDVSELNDFLFFYFYDNSILLCLDNLNKKKVLLALARAPYLTSKDVYIHVIDL